MRGLLLKILSAVTKTRFTPNLPPKKRKKSQRGAFYSTPQNKPVNAKNLAEKKNKWKKEILNCGIAIIMEYVY